MFVSHSVPFALVVAIPLLLSGCKGSDDTHSQVPARKKITEVSFKNQALKQCVKWTAEREKLIYVDQLKRLTCNSVGHDLYSGFFVGDELGTAIISSEGLTELVALEELQFSAQWLSDIDFSKLPNLTKLSLDNNIFQSLDLSKNAQLKELDISCNPISTLTLPQNSKLERLVISGGGCVAIEFLDREPSEWVDLRDKASGMPLTEASFDQPLNSWLDLSAQNQLRELTMSHRNSNVNLSFNLPVDNNLHSLELQGSQIKELDIGNLVQLDVLSASLTGLENVKFPINNKITKMGLMRANLNSATLASLSASAELVELGVTGLVVPPTPPKLQRLFLMGDFDGKDFHSMPELEELSIWDGGSSTKNLGAMQLPNLRILEISGALDNSHLELDQLTNLERVYVEGVVESFSSASTHTLKNLVLTFSGETLDLSGYSNLNKLTISAPNIVPFGLQVQPNLSELSLWHVSWDSLEVDGLTELTSLSLMDCSFIESLDVSGMPKLSRLFLANMYQLQQLDLTGMAVSIDTLSIRQTALVDIKATDQQRAGYTEFWGNTHLSAASVETLKRLNTNAVIF